MIQKAPFLYRSKHGIFYVRIVVPVPKRTSVGRTELRRSLGTGSIREARQKAPEVLKEMFSILGSGLAQEAVKTSPESSQALSSGTPVNSPIIPSPNISQVMELFSKALEHEQISLKTIDDKRAVVRLLVRIVGDKSASSFTLEDAKRFREIALQLPPRINRIPNDKSLEEIIRETNQTISVTTYNNHVKNLKSVFAFAEREGLTGFNPFRAMKVRQRVRQSSFRSVFESGEIERIFSHTELERGWKYWLPRLGMFTGCRMNELCQLYVDDISMIEGINCIHVQAVKDDQSLKSLSSERVIPVHSMLVELGFIGYVDSRSKGERLFPDLVRHAKHGYSATPSKWFARVRQKVQLSEGEGRKDFHSFRHTVADTLKQEGYSENLIGGLLGHTTGGITNNRYGKQYNPSSLLEVVEAIKAV